MFGYITINEPELKVKDLNRYRSFYCGLCHELKERGELARFTLSYDMTFLAVLLSGLYEPEIEEKAFVCPAHPFEKKSRISTEILEYVADMNIILSYYKCVDDWHDERKTSSLAFAAGFKKTMADLNEKYPEKCRTITTALKKIAYYERKFAGRKLSVKALDKLSGISGRMLSAVFAMKDDEWNDELSALGFYLGRFVYLADSYEDLENDKKQGVFNPLVSFEDRADFDEWIKKLLMMTASEAAAYFEKLPILQDVEILRNIIYAGVWTRVRETAERRGVKDGESISDTGR